MSSSASGWNVGRLPMFATASRREASSGGGFATSPIATVHA
jgi:hypothetical protein